MTNNKAEKKAFKLPEGIVLEVLGVSVGAVIAAVAIRLFLDPFSIVPGGVSGLSMGVERLARRFIPDAVSIGSASISLLWIKEILKKVSSYLIYSVLFPQGKI